MTFRVAPFAFSVQVSVSADMEEEEEVQELEEEEEVAEPGAQGRKLVISSARDAHARRSRRASSVHDAA